MHITRLHKLLRFSFLCLVLAMVAGCAENDSFEQPQLSVSEKDIAFSNQMGEKTITVSTNCKEWVATTPKPWVHLTRNGNGIAVQVDANTTGAERSSYILVDGGLAVEKVMVKQSAADISIDIANGEIILPQVGGTTTVDVNMESSMYELLQNEKPEWLQIVRKKHALKFISRPNYDVTERTTKLTITFGGKSSEVIVRQPGVATFILACNPGNPFSLHKMMDFEYRRGSLLHEYGGPDTANGIYEESYFFRTPSPLFKDVVYVHDTKYFTPTRIYTRSLVKEGVDAVKSQAFQDFVKANGYVRDEKDPNHYVNVKESMTMDVDIMEKNNSVVLFFYQIHSQDRDYETFKSLDLGPLELLGKADKKVSAVEEYEASQNSEEMKRQVSKSREIEAILYKTTDPTLIARTYFFYLRGGDSPAPQDKVGSVEQYSLFYGQPNLGIWQYGREWLVTREFDKLLTSNNFEFVGYSGKHHVYARRSDYLTLAISGGEFADVNNGKPIMQISVLYKPTVFAGSKQQRMAKIESMLKKHNPSR